MENDGGMPAELSRPRGWLLLLALLAGNVALAMGPWFVRLADTGPVSAGFWRLLLALPFLAVFARFSGQALTGIPRRTLMFVALGAVAFGPEVSCCYSGALSFRAACRAARNGPRLYLRLQARQF